ncbi:hypothetical protein P1J78_07200 [Psychromarinibacter sp. C21-152]|uniref:Uncharacterized protein n=1 Tax=Psychromarinibacter sediminicola TaxID=3033385 RepID=A0AAE3NTZ4_9RHOB|nr:hypothetical protein [Psychromarinibacter sediminicola]MDF0600512.1 hypothetical protein [Psychromarinibacter sediminicola]
MKPLVPLLALLCAGATGAAAETLACQAMRTCMVDRKCAEAQEVFTLTLDGARATLAGADGSAAFALDADTGTGAARLGDRVYQLRLTGDGGGLILRTPVWAGNFEDAELLWLHCGPA